VSVGVDPLASLRAWSLEVTVGGRDYRLRSLHAADWLVILLGDPLDLSQILPGLLCDEAEEEELEAALLGGRVTEAEIREAALEVVSAVAGRPWWWVFNLLGAAATAWTALFGRLVAAGVDVQRLPLGAALDALYVMCTDGMKKEHREQFNRELERPPAGVEQELSAEEEEAQFLALMNSR
jgi:hypothetical protein